VVFLPVSAMVEALPEPPVVAVPSGMNEL
jgi:hypothetical protein